MAKSTVTHWLSAYPELRAVVGANVPDLRGLFLRGTGGNAAALGTVQEDAGRDLSGSLTLASGGPASTSGCFTYSYVGGWGDDMNGKYGINTIYISGAAAWGASHVAAEFRPRNRAVRYLIRAKS